MDSGEGDRPDRGAIAAAKIKGEDRERECARRVVIEPMGKVEERRRGEAHERDGRIANANRSVVSTGGMSLRVGGRGAHLADLPLEGHAPEQAGNAGFDEVCGSS